MSTNVSTLPRVPKRRFGDFVEEFYLCQLHHILVEIFSHLSAEDVERCKVVNSHWNGWIRANIFAHKQRFGRLRQEWKEIIDENWRKSDPGISERFELTEKEAMFKNVCLVADKKEVFLSLGSALILVWNRVSGKTTRLSLNLDKKTIRELNFSSPAPLLAFNEETLIVYFYHDGTLRTFSRPDYGEEQKMTCKALGFVKKLLLTRAHLWLVMPDEKKCERFRLEGQKLTDQSPTNFLRNDSVELFNLNALACIDGKFYVGAKTDKGIYVLSGYGDADPLELKETFCKAELLNVSKNHFVVAQNLEPPKIEVQHYAGVYCRSTFALVKEVWHHSWYPPPRYVCMDKFDAQVNDDRLVLSCFSTDSRRLKRTQVHFYAYEFSNQDQKGRPILFYSGQHRRVRSPVFLLEEDGLIVGEEDKKDFVFKSFWKVKSKVAEIPNHLGFVPDFDKWGMPRYLR